MNKNIEETIKKYETEIKKCKTRAAKSKERQLVMQEDVHNKVPFIFGMFVAEYGRYHAIEKTNEAKIRQYRIFISKLKDIK